MRDLTYRSEEKELMDSPDLDFITYQQVLIDLAKANRCTLAYRPTMSFLQRTLAGRAHFRLLDVGYGNGDMLRKIARWAANHHMKAELVGVDLNPNSASVARNHTPPELDIHWCTGDYAEFSGEGFDVVISSLVAHHMTHTELLCFLCFMEREAKMGWFINDLYRHPFSALAFPMLARLMGWHPIVRHDGTLSIARSYRSGEWPAILKEAGIAPGASRVFRTFPFRLCVERQF